MHVTCRTKTPPIFFFTPSFLLFSSPDQKLTEPATTTVQNPRRRVAFDLSRSIGSGEQYFSLIGSLLLVCPLQ